TSTSSLGEWVSSLSTALTDGITSVLQSLGSSKALAAVLGVFDKLFAREVHTDTLCVGDVCVTQEQFLKMVQSRGATPTSPAAPSTGGSTEQAPTDITPTEILPTDVVSADTSTTTPPSVQSTDTIVPTTPTAPPTDTVPTVIEVLPADVAPADTATTTP
ncbi:MAG: hypothetical protein AAB794_00520, partial [Patescibacteria group bacterium]